MAVTASKLLSVIFVSVGIARILTAKALSDQLGTNND